MSKPAQNPEIVRTQILNATIPLFSTKGFKLTMDEIAMSARISKKTIYQAFPKKEDLFHAMVDYVFDDIQQGKTKIFERKDLSPDEKLVLSLNVLGEKLENVDLSKLHVLKERYPDVYAHVAVRLQTGWEQTFEIMEEGIRIGLFRPFRIEIFKLMLESTLEQFFQNDFLGQNGITYDQALHEVVELLMKGIEKQTAQ